MAVRWWAAVAGLGPSGGAPGERTTAPRAVVGRALRAGGGASAGGAPKAAPPPRRPVPPHHPAVPAGRAPPRRPRARPRHAGFPPRAEGAEGAGGGRVAPGAAGFDRPPRRPGAGSFLNLFPQPVALRPGEPAVVAGDGKARPFGEVVGQP